MDDKRSSRRVKNRVSVYYKKIDENDLDRVREEIYHTIEPDDSFTFFASLKGLDSSFGDLNKAFVVMMKEMDSKLNYIIGLLREGGSDYNLKGFKKGETCDLSQSGLSVECENEMREGEWLYMKMFLPIALHHPIKLLAKVVRVEKRKDLFCVGVEIEDITAENRELIIHYMIYVERKMAKNRVERDVE